MMKAKTRRCRYRLTVRGVVQGVGFRPFIYWLATELGLSGGVQNTAKGVVIEVEGTPEQQAEFLRRLQTELPPHAKVRAIAQQHLPLKGEGPFEIWPSDKSDTTRSAEILPDMATCPDCLQDIFNAHSRRYHYPFTNCTHCGPRFSIVTALPYDRRHTTMAGFSLCPNCEAEYSNPADAHFHAQPTACPHCGPHLAFLSTEQLHLLQTMQPDLLAPAGWMAKPLTHGEEPLQQAIAALRQGKIVAIKGIGGFQLLVDAHHDAAVQRLRSRKRRPDKPLAIMCASLEQVCRYCRLSHAAARALISAQAPIVLLPKRASNLAEAIAPGNPCLGVMLPTSPLHHLLLRQYGSPLVATSGNPSGEPICIDEQAAWQRLGAIADGFLIHNRTIQRPVDDSVVQILNGQSQLLRHARGYAPQSLRLVQASDLALGLKSDQGSHPEHRILAVGAHQKSAIALSMGEQIVLGQHLGDLDSCAARERLQQTVEDWLGLYSIVPDAIACDLHPDYGSTQLAQNLAQRWHLPLIPVQHHYAHILAAMAENALQATDDSPILGIAWDGTGYGLDHTLWGGEFLKIVSPSPSTRSNPNSPEAASASAPNGPFGLEGPPGFERIASFLPLPLPGGEICTKEPRRCALGLLYSCYANHSHDPFESLSDLPPIQAFSPDELTVLRQMLQRQLNSPTTSSVGRLFDGVAALLGLHQQVTFEGQAAMTLEFAASQVKASLPYPYLIESTLEEPEDLLIIDWRPMVRAIVEDIRMAVPAQAIAARFHYTLADIMVDIARRSGIHQVVLSGGCFQNKVLSEKGIERLTQAGFTPYWHRHIPPNDGGLAVGQILAAWRQLGPALGPEIYCRED